MMLASPPWQEAQVRPFSAWMSSGKGFVGVDSDPPKLEWQIRHVFLAAGLSSGGCSAWASTELGRRLHTTRKKRKRKAACGNRVGLISHIRNNRHHHDKNHSPDAEPLEGPARCPVCGFRSRTGGVSGCSATGIQVMRTTARQRGMTKPIRDPMKYFEDFMAHLLCGSLEHPPVSRPRSWTLLEPLSRGIFNIQYGTKGTPGNCRFGLEDSGCGAVSLQV